MPDAVLAEIFYVLVSFFGVPRETAVDELVALLRRRNLETLRLGKGLAIRALLLCRPSNRVSIVDALVWAAARGTDGPVVHAFDQHFPADGIELRIP